MTIRPIQTMILVGIVDAILWSVGFLSGLVLGFYYPIIGDITAVLLSGSLVLGIQTIMLPKQVQQRAWLVQTGLGLLVGILLSFFFTLLLSRLAIVPLDVSHVIAFPVIIVVIALFQYSDLAKYYETDLAFSWAVFPTLGIVGGMFVIGLLSTVIPIELTVLENRGPDLIRVLPWGLIGGVLGLGYGMSTGFVIGKLHQASNSTA